jgi:hypothetical protein
MRLPAVRFDDESLGPPEEVGLDGGEVVYVEPFVHFRAWQGSCPTQRQEALLQLGVREGGLLETRKDRPEHAGAAAAVGPGEDLIDGAQVEQPQHLGLLDDSLEISGIDHLG